MTHLPLLPLLFCLASPRLAAAHEGRPANENREKAIREEEIRAHVKQMIRRIADRETCGGNLNPPVKEESDI